jgi:hypothetical protein
MPVWIRVEGRFIDQVNSLVRGYTSFATILGSDEWKKRDCRAEACFEKQFCLRFGARTREEMNCIDETFSLIVNLLSIEVIFGAWPIKYPTLIIELLGNLGQR